MVEALEPVVVELDNPSGLITKLPGSFNGMQGDSNVPIDLLLVKDSRPYDLDDITVGWQQLNADANGLDVKGTTVNIAGRGRTRFILPSAVFAVAGTVEGNFYIESTSDNVKIYGAKMSFTVEPNDVLMNVNTGPFMTDWETFKAKMDALYDEIQKTYTDPNSGVMQLAATVKTEVEAYQTALDNNDFVTLQTFNALKTAVGIIDKSTVKTANAPSTYKSASPMQPTWEYWPGSALGLGGALYLVRSIAPGSTITGAGVLQSATEVTLAGTPNKWDRLSKSDTEWGTFAQNTTF